jgi:putative transposase
MQGWDYGLPGYYFITICTQNRILWFGEIYAGEIILSSAGKIAANELQNTTKIRPNVNLDAWIVMPNHVHAIIVLTVETPRRGVSSNPRRAVSTQINWRPGTLGAIINQFKSVCTKRIRASWCSDFSWQARYYDHIVRNERELDNIRKYILGNVAKWDDDEYFSPSPPTP